MKRRTLLLAGGGLAVTFLGGCALPVIPKRPKPELDDALSWIQFANGRYNLAQSRVAASTFADSPIPRLADVPLMEVLLIDEGEAPTGAGETAIVAAGAAVANAVRDATGVRLTRLPLRAADVQKLAR